MLSFTQLFVIAAAISIAYGATYEVTDSITDYYFLSQRELLNDVSLLNVQMAGVDARILDRVNVIPYEQEQLLNEINIVNQTYVQLQALSPQRKYCIQKYEANFITYDMAVRQLENCLNIQPGNTTTYTSMARKFEDFARNMATKVLHSYAITCDTSSDHNEKLLCYVRYMLNLSESINEQFSSFKDSLEKALFESAQAYKSGINCSFKVEKNVLEAIGQTTMSIQTCEACFESGNLAADC